MSKNAGRQHGSISLDGLRNYFEDFQNRRWEMIFKKVSRLPIEVHEIIFIILNKNKPTMS